MTSCLTYDLGMSSEPDTFDNCFESLLIIARA
jgi:hypothetical protein